MIECFKLWGNGTNGYYLHLTSASSSPPPPTPPTPPTHHHKHDYQASGDCAVHWSENGPNLLDGHPGHQHRCSWWALCNLWKVKQIQIWWSWSTTYFVKPVWLGAVQLSIYAALLSLQNISDKPPIFPAVQLCFLRRICLINHQLFQECSQSWFYSSWTLGSSRQCSATERDTTSSARPKGLNF